MNRVWTGVAAGVLAATVLVGVGIGAYRAGQDDDGRVTRVVTEQVEGEDGEIVRVVERDGRHGPGFGFFLIPLVVIGGILLITRAGRHRHHWGHGYGYGPGRWGGPGSGPGCGPDDPARAWHRRMHEADAADAGVAPDAGADATPAATPADERPTPPTG